MSANNAKFTKFDSLSPKDYPEHMEFLNAIINMWQPLDMRLADKELDGADPEEVIRIIANDNSTGRFVAVSSISNNMTEGHRLTEEDEANAALISRAPALYMMLGAFVGLIRNGHEIDRDSLLVKAASAILREVRDGKVQYRVELTEKDNQPEDSVEEYQEGPER